MNTGRIVYVTYIAASPERVWNALRDAEATTQYWSHLNVSDWKVGSEWKHQRPAPSNKIDVLGKVLESSPPRRLVISWASPSDINRPEEVSRVTFDIEPYHASHARLTVTHDELRAGSQMEHDCSGGWPLVGSNLKSYLETGKAMPL